MKMNLKPIKITYVDSVSLTVKIKITNQFKIRRIISLVLMKLALRIIPCTAELVVEHKPPLHPNCRCI